MGLEIAATAIRSSNFRFTDGQAMGLSLEQFYISSEDRLHQLERIGTWCSWVSMYTVNDHKHVWPQQHFPNLQWKFNPNYFVVSLLMGRVTNQQVSVVSCDSLDPGSSNIYGEPKTSLHQTENGVIILMQLASSQDHAKNITIPVTGDIHCALQTHNERTRSIGRNMLKMVSIWSSIFTQYALIEGVQPKTMRKWANTSLTLWPYYI